MHLNVLRIWRRYESAHVGMVGTNVGLCLSSGLPLDLLRCESLLGLDPATCSRVLNKNYKLLVSMAPLSNEIRPISSCTPQVAQAHPGECIQMAGREAWSLGLVELCACSVSSKIAVLSRVPSQLNGSFCASGFLRRMKRQLHLCCFFMCFFLRKAQARARILRRLNWRHLMLFYKRFL